MESHRFDILTRRLGAASRRQALSALVAGALAPLLPRPDGDEAAAKCKGYKGKCKKKSQCCGKDGLECHHDRCRCKKGWKHCPGTGTDCTHIKADSDNCGACGNECPMPTPCCINGSCDELCGGSCCADCYVDFNGPLPQPDTATCCGPGAGNFCRAKKHDKSDDKCCYPDQECIDGECCSDGGLFGSVICGGQCCPSVACCNGECCPEGQVCAMTTEGLTCEPANRDCDNDDQCHTGETCVGGTCCQGDRLCSDLGVDFCCPAGEYCDFLGPNGACCAINTQCKSTWRSHRVRR